jgi:nickel-dependent lactate racemase
MTGLGYEDRVLTDGEWRGLLDRWMLEHVPGRRVLLVPPDLTRCYSFAGAITSYLYRKLSATHEVSVMPAVGTHMQMEESEREAFFPGVPGKAFLTHDWREDAVCVGTVPAAFCERVSGGLWKEDIRVQVNRRLVSGEFDSVFSIGQVVPHEVVGMANYTKNIVVGLGGREMINKSHMISAVCGIESIMGNPDSSVRAVFDYAQREFLDRLGITFILTVTQEEKREARLYGLYLGEGRDTFEAASALAAKKNITWLPEREKKVVAYLEPSEFRSMWVGNKAIYRTRMAIADGGELVILAPGVRQFGENDEVDACIRKCGYRGTERILPLYEKGAFEGLEMVAAHLIHGSSEDRFRIVYATDPALLSQKEVESAGFSWADVRELLDVYRPEEKETGRIRGDGESYYFIKTPAVGLWRV